MDKSFRLPAEWEKQSGVMLTWPHQHTDWADSLSSIEPFFIDLAKAICNYEKLLLITYDELHQTHVKSLLEANDIPLSSVVFSTVETNDTWTRDYGPIGLSNGEQIFLQDFRFNAWGNKFSIAKDNTVNKQLIAAQHLLCHQFQSHSLVLEGGSIDVDGKGTLLTTKQCLLNKNRNPDLSQAEIEEYLSSMLNIHQIHWLSEGLIIGDDTDSHIDMLARFVSPRTIVYAACENKDDPHFKPLSLMHAELRDLKSFDNIPYQLKALPIPDAIIDDEGNRLPASYVNFLVINGAVLLPIYGDKNDDIAIEVLKDCFPDRKIIPINARAAIAQGGSLHCLTMQLIDGVLK